MGHMATARPPRREQGRIEERGGNLRVVVHAGLDPVTRRRTYKRVVLGEAQPRNRRVVRQGGSRGQHPRGLWRLLGKSLRGTPPMPYSLRWKTVHRENTRKTVTTTAWLPGARPMNAIQWPRRPCVRSIRSSVVRSMLPFAGAGSSQSGENRQTSQADAATAGSAIGGRRGVGASFGRRESRGLPSSSARASGLLVHRRRVQSRRSRWRSRSSSMDRRSSSCVDAAMMRVASPGSSQPGSSSPGCRPRASRCARHSRKRTSTARLSARWVAGFIPLLRFMIGDERPSGWGSVRQR